MSQPPGLYLDADLSPRIAEVGRRLGIDVVSAHELGRGEAEDEDQLAWAAADGRVLVTRNRDDFLRLTVDSYHERTPHAGLLLLPPAGSRHQVSRIAHVLVRWVREHEVVSAYGVYWLRLDRGPGHD